MKDVELDPIPNCQICKARHAAAYDSPYRPGAGTWAYMCEKVFKAHGNPTLGFRLIPKGSK